jgi:predicted ester cyclase
MVCRTSRGEPSRALRRVRVKDELLARGKPPMGSMKETAEKFFEACDSGRGWGECSRFCHDGATFSVQADALRALSTIEEYTGWARDLLTPIPDGAGELRALAVDEERQTACAFGVFRGTHTGEGGPVPPTGNRIETEYVYVMQFDGDRIRHLTKIWNDGSALAQLGWS